MQDSLSPGPVTSVENDVTEYERLIHELRHDITELRALIESAPDALIIIDPQGLIKTVNRQAECLFGYSPEEMLGQSVEMLMPARLHEAHQSHRRVFRNDPQRREMGSGLDLIARRADGREVPIEVSLNPFTADGGMEVCAAIRDMTDRKQAEEAIRLAKEQAEKASSVKSRFLATASHDLRQPLQSINLLNAALLKTVDDPDARRMILLQRDSIGSMMSLLNALLDITKLESGTVRPAFRTVHMSEILEGLRAEFLPLTEERGLDFRMNSCGQVVHCDPELLMQLLQNLIANAIRYTDQGYVQISCHPEDDRLRISIEDTGRGIPRDQFDAIFEEFRQLDQESERGRGGLGLGLAIVHRISALLDAPIEIDSDVGKGSRFSVMVPLAEKDTLKPAGIDAPEDGAEDLSCHILVVDDDAAVLEASRIFLSSVEGLRVTVASTADEAYRILREDGPDIIVTDFRLAGGATGLDLVADARRNGRRQVGGILVTGDTSVAVEDMESADLVLLYKPVDPDELLATLKALLEVRVD